jgi:hypothetical protein
MIHCWLCVPQSWITPLLWLLIVFPPVPRNGDNFRYEGLAVLRRVQLFFYNHILCSFSLLLAKLGLSAVFLTHNLCIGYFCFVFEILLSPTALSNPFRNSRGFFPLPTLSYVRAFLHWKYVCVCVRGVAFRFRSYRTFVIIIFSEFINLTLTFLALALASLKNRNHLPVSVCQSASSIVI